MTSLIPRNTAIADLFRVLEEGFPFAGRHVVRVEDYQEDGQYVLRAELPGVDPAQDIDVSVDGNLLTVTAERSDSRHEKSHSEFRYGSFGRSVRLPAGADPAGITASYEAGVLEVRVPITEASPARRIAVEVGKP
ncbi:Hsp20/alpha crystallin family protein [Actinokineospora sp. UTMC 2448]|uniref:Hsp20/alpha crystallin family protein n=1 Tax=Actinokineospora sp. UTMC 2448 TaxID=2268449 RepID=UPI002164479C|nr:Hsp20/alpha crystallin family protein [Actinokineospora sp. UTMC 2448]UVS79443.1 Nox16 [Actinokineospora sp. UTMC 2448]